LKDNNLTQAIIESFPNFACITDKNGNITNTNSRAREILKEDAIKENTGSIFEVIKTYDIKLEGIEESTNIIDLLREALVREFILKDKIVKLKRREKDYYISFSSYPIKMDEELKGFMMTCINVTQEQMKNIKLMEEREKFLTISTELKTKCDIIEILRNREKEHLMHLKDVINNISEGLIVLNNKGNFNFCNKSTYSILEMTPTEIMHYPNIFKKYEVYSLGITAQAIVSIDEGIFKRGMPIKNLVLYLEERSTGKIKYIEFNSTPIKNKNEELLYTILTLKDITEVRQHEIYAKEQARFVKDVVDTLDIPIAVIHYPYMNIKLANKKFEYLLECISGRGIDAQNIIGQRIESLLIKSEDCTVYKGIQRAGDSGCEYTCSPYEVVDSKGYKRFFKIKFKPYINKDGATETIHIHAVDITDEINHNLELEKMTFLKDEFFTIISHELRTPLTIIYSSIQLAYHIYNKDITSSIHRTLTRINQNCSRLLKLTNNILDISKAEAGFLTNNPVSFDIVYTTEFIVTSVNFYAKSKEIDLIFDTNEEEAAVFLDKDKYEKILLNLLSNAVKFTSVGKQILVTLIIEEDTLKLSIKDEGVGIPENKLESIFDRFAQVNNSLTRRAEGTGLGLSLVKKLVELMGGNIKVESVEEEGSEFILIFKKISIEYAAIDNYSIVDANMDEKINIEFSDV
jgi:signal transduction histidine kinase